MDAAYKCEGREFLCNTLKSQQFKVQINAIDFYIFSQKKKPAKMKNVKDKDGKRF